MVNERIHLAGDRKLMLEPHEYHQLDRYAVGTTVVIRGVARGIQTTSGDSYVGILEGELKEKGDLERRSYAVFRGTDSQPGNLGLAVALCQTSAQTNAPLRIRGTIADEGTVDNPSTITVESIVLREELVYERR